MVTVYSVVVVDNHHWEVVFDHNGMHVYLMDYPYVTNDGHRVLPWMMFGDSKQPHFKTGFTQDCSPYRCAGDTPVPTRQQFVDALVNN
jgi:hypothetical protein